MDGILNVEAVEAGAKFTGGTPSGDFASAIGTCLISDNEEVGMHGPNLLEGICQRDTKSWRRELVRLALPIAAVLLLALGMG